MSAPESVPLRAGELEARFAPAAGMVCWSLRHRGEELLAQRDGLETYAATGKTMGIPLLHPWANRLAEWEYDALGRHVDLRACEGGLLRPDGETGLPMHGTVPRAWDVEDASEARLVAVLADGASSAFPFPHAVRMEATLDERGLRIATTVLAEADEVPVAFGFHPYLTLPGVARDDYRVELPVLRHLVLDGKKVPTGETKPVEPFAGALEGHEFDDGYDELAEPPVFVLEGGGRRLELAFEAGYGCAQAFAPAGKDLVAFEPMTAPANALRTGAFRVATPDAPYSAAFALTVA